MCHAQISHNFPVLCLDATAYVELVLDDAVRIDGQILVAVDGGADVEVGAHEWELGVEFLVATGKDVDGFGLAAVDLGTD